MSAFTEQKKAVPFSTAAGNVELMHETLARGNSKNEIRQTQRKKVKGRESKGEENGKGKGEMGKRKRKGKGREGVITK